MSKQDPAARYRRKKLQRYLRSTGRSGVVEGAPAQEVRDRVAELNRRGMTYTAMCKQAGVSLSTFHYVINHDGPPRMLRTTYDKLSGLTFEKPALRGALRPALATQRMTQALRAAGFTQVFLCSELDMSEEGLYNLCQQVAQNVRLETEVAVTTLYQNLELVNPATVGISASGQAFARTIAAKHGWAPPTCWDLETIGDPEAIPEWTGECGTARGTHLHRKYGIPVCRPCSRARAQYKADQKKGRYARDLNPSGTAQ